MTPPVNLRRRLRRRLIRPRRRQATDESAHPHATARFSIA
jgi:hypothetical protein